MIKLKDLLLEKTVRLPSMDINFRGDMAQLLGNKGRLAISRQDAKAILYAIRKEFSIHESTGKLNEKIIKIHNSLKVELTRRDKYELVKIYGRKGYVEVYGRKEIRNFARVLVKNFKIV